MFKRKKSTRESEGLNKSNSASILKNGTQTESEGISPKNQQAAQLQAITEDFLNNQHPLSSSSTSSAPLLSESAVIQQYPYINSDPPGTKDALIYGIFKMNNGVEGDCVYVGQTTMARAGDRFVEHVQEDDWAPWYGGDYSSEDTDDWPYVPRKLEGLKDVTRFEVTAAEQWWIEHEQATKKLDNRINAMTKATFEKYKTIPGNYDYTKIDVGKTWKPSK